MPLAKWEEDEVALSCHVAYAEQGAVMTWVHFGCRLVSFCHHEDGNGSCWLGGSMLPRSTSWKSLGARGGPPKAIRAIFLLILLSSRGSVMLIRGPMGQTLTSPSLLMQHLSSHLQRHHPRGGAISFVLSIFEWRSRFHTIGY
jgi:hypothetical protein